MGAGSGAGGARPRARASRPRAQSQAERPIIGFLYWTRDIVAVETNWRAMKKREELSHLTNGMAETL